MRIETRKYCLPPGHSPLQESNTVSWNTGMVYQLRIMSEEWQKDVRYSTSTSTPLPYLNDHNNVQSSTSSKVIELMLLQLHRVHVPTQPPLAALFLATTLCLHRNRRSNHTSSIDKLAACLIFTALSILFEIA